MKRLAALLLLLAGLTASAQERPFALRRDFGTLYGTLLAPEGSDAAVIIIAGSGPTDRNGNSPAGIRCDTYRLLAEALAERGIASLRYDKRAIGSSLLDDPNQLAGLTFDMYVDDAAALADRLAEEGFRRIVLAGHSEGALVALCAARRSESVAAAVSIAGAGYPLDEIVRLQLAAQLVPAHMDIQMEAECILAALKRGERVDMTYRHPGLQPLFNHTVQPFIISQLRYDPQREIRALDCPVLVIGGGNDLQVSAGNAEALASAQPRARKVILPGMTHTLKHSDDRTLDAQRRTVYADPSLPLAPGLADAIADFVGALP